MGDVEPRGRIGDGRGEGMVVKAVSVAVVWVEDFERGV